MAATAQTARVSVQVLRAYDSSSNARVARESSQVLRTYESVSDARIGRISVQVLLTPEPPNGSPAVTHAHLNIGVTANPEPASGATHAHLNVGVAGAIPQDGATHAHLNVMALLEKQQWGLLTPLASGFSYASEVSADSPIAWWRFNEASGATTATDSSGNGYNGTYAGDPTFAAGIGGSNAVTFDKVDDHVSISSNAAFYPTASNSLAYELWYKGTDAGTDTNWSGWAGLFAANASISNKKFAIGIDSNGHAAALADDQYSSIASTTAINDGNWHHIVFTVAASSYNTALWVDGVNEASSATPDDPGSGAPTVYIGYFARSGIRVAGEIDEVAIYSSGSGDALPSDRIAAHYAAGAP